MVGLDVEPDPNEMLAEPTVNLTVRNCRSINNIGGGYEVSVKYNDATTYAAPRRPMGILFDNCSVSTTGDDTDRGCDSGNGYVIGGPKVGARGTITVRNAIIEGTATAGIRLINTAPAGSAIGNVSVAFENIRLSNVATHKQCGNTNTYAYVHTQACSKRPRNSICSENVTTAPIMTSLVVNPGYTCCAATFTNVSVVDTQERPFLFMDAVWNLPGHNMLSGDITVSNSNHRPRSRQIGCKMTGPNGTTADPPPSLSVSCTNIDLPTRGVALSYSAATGPVEGDPASTGLATDGSSLPQQCGIAAIPPTLNATKETGGTPGGGVQLQVERAGQVIFNVAEAIHGAHGLGFALRSSGDLQVTVGVNFKNSLVKHWVPTCGVPAAKPTFQCTQTRSKRSSDQGGSWEMLPINTTTNRSVSEFSNYAFEFEDGGEVIQFTGVQLGNPRQISTTDSVIQMEMIRSTDGAKSQTVSVVPVVAPSGLLAEGWISTSHSSIVQLHGGALLANVYAPWRGVDGYNEPAKRSKTRVCVLRSDDRGAHWHYVSTVAWDAVNATAAEDQSSNCEVNGMCNGFDEASLVVVPSPVGFGRAGETVVCVMRSGGPLYRAFSLDGVSWSTPQVIAPHGVSPQAIIMRPSNIMAIAYGRPFNWLRFSLDGGRTFLPEICYNRPPMEPWDGGEYDSVMQIPGTDRLLLTYAHCTDNPFDMDIRGLTLTVKRLKTEDEASGRKTTDVSPVRAVYPAHRLKLDDSDEHDASVAPQPPAKPNIVLPLADDLGSNQVGYAASGPISHTRVGNVGPDGPLGMKTDDSDASVSAAIEWGLAPAALNLQASSTYPTRAAAVVDLAGQLGECEHVQLWLRSPTAELTNVKVAFGPMYMATQRNGGGELLAASAWAYRQQGYVFNNCSAHGAFDAWNPCREGWLPDPLLPPVPGVGVPRVPVNFTQPLFLDLCIPLDSAPGKYKRGVYCQFALPFSVPIDFFI
jgi:hypothetical protein